MVPDDRDVTYLWDIIEASREAIAFTSDITFHEYQNDRMRRRAVERCIEIVGEASRRLSDNFKDAYTDIPWRAIVAQRNVLAHEYGEIVHERIWRVAREQLPPLVNRLEALLPPLPPADAT